MCLKSLLLKTLLCLCFTRIVGPPEMRANEQYWSQSAFVRIVSNVAPETAFALHTVKMNNGGLLNGMLAGDFSVSKSVTHEDVVDFFSTIRASKSAESLSQSSLRAISFSGGGYIEISLLVDGAPIFLEKRFALVGPSGENALISTILRVLRAGVIGTALETEIDRVQRLAGERPPVIYSDDRRKAEFILFPDAVDQILGDRELDTIVEIDLSAMASKEFSENDVQRLVRLIKERNLLVTAQVELAEYLGSNGIPAARIRSRPKRLHPLLFDPRVFMKER